MKNLIMLVVALPLSFCMQVSGQLNANKLLGYSEDTRLLILHADDLGMSHSTNMALFDAVKSSPLKSGSVMVPCPWFMEMASFLKEHPEIDAGIHLTLNAEWKNYKWDGILPSNEIPSLIDSNGYFHQNLWQMLKDLNPDEVIREARAQIDRALKFGIKPTHIDVHTGAILMSPVILRQLFSISREYGMPLTIPMNLVKIMAPHMISEIPDDVVVVDNFYSMYAEISNGDWNKIYSDIIRSLKPGLNEMVFHLSYDDAEMRAISEDHPEFGSAWRQKDLDFILSDELRTLLKEQGVVLITWRDIQKKLPAPAH